jgi:hypothetical protein
VASPETPEIAELVSILRSGQASLEIRRFAARGLLPLDRHDQTRALLAVIEDDDSDIAEDARAALLAVPPDEITAFLVNGDPRGSELDSIARYSDDSFVLEQVIRHKEVSDPTLARLAREVTGAPQEALVINQFRLLRNPALIDALFENPELTPDARRRLLEVREEFFDKEVRRKEAEIIRGEDEERLAKEIAEAELEEERIKRDAAVISAAAKAELDKSLTTGAAYRRIAVMTVSEKIKLAYSGGKEERRILMADANKLVGAAVLKSRGLTANEVESFCTMRHLDEEIFRKIAGNREWMRKQAIIGALVKNPKVNLAISLPLIKRLHDRDLKAIVRDPNLPEGVRINARKVVQERRK